MHEKIERLKSHYGSHTAVAVEVFGITDRHYRYVRSSGKWSPRLCRLAEKELELIDLKERVAN